MSTYIICEIELCDGVILTTSILTMPKSGDSIYILDENRLRLYNVDDVKLVATDFPYIVISGGFDASEYED